MAKTRKEKGFILIILLFMMLLLAVTAVALNVKSGMQAKMAANRTVDVQTYLDQLAVIEQSLWKLAGDPSWRITAGESYTYNGTPYNRKVFGPDAATYPALAAYSDAVIISVRAPNAERTVNKSFRYHVIPIKKRGQVSLDSAGNIYFTDMYNHRVWKIDAITGNKILVAGTGIAGYTGDSAPAVNATLNSPQGVAVDDSGNVYIADTENHRIRKVTGTTISTVAGTGTADYDGEGSAMSKSLNNPTGVFAAGTDLYISDTENNRIRKVTGNTISTVAGTGTAGYDGEGSAMSKKLNKPQGVFVSGTNIYIADTENNRIRKVTAGTISTVAGTWVAGYDGEGFPATSKQLNKPQGIFVSGTDIYMADTENHRIRKVTGNTISTVAGTGTAGYDGEESATNKRLSNPTGVFAAGTDLYIFDTENNRIRKVTGNAISTVPNTEVPWLKKPQGIATYYDAALEKLFLYIADRDNNRIRKLDTVTGANITVAGTGERGYTGDDDQATNATLNSPAGVAVDVSGNVYIADTSNCCIRRIDISGTITTVAGSPKPDGTPDCSFSESSKATKAKLNKPTGIFAAGTDLYISDTENNRIRKVTGNTISTVAGTGTAGYNGEGSAMSKQLNKPQGVFVSGTNIYIADTENNRIRKVTAGAISTVAGTWVAGYSGDGGAATAARLKKPHGVWVDAEGNIYIADTENHALRIVNHAITPIISTLAGIGEMSGYRDSQPAVEALLDSPGGVAMDLTKGRGRIFISDTNNNRIRMLFLKTAKEVYGP